MATCCFTCLTTWHKTHMDGKGRTQHSCLSLVFCRCSFALMIVEALWVDLQQCYKLGLAGKVAKGIVALAVCSGLNVWIAVHQGKSTMFAHASYTKKLVFFSGACWSSFMYLIVPWESFFSCRIKCHAFGLLSEMLARIANYLSYLMHHYHYFHSNTGLYTMKCFSFKYLEHLRTVIVVINRPLK